MVALRDGSDAYGRWQLLPQPLHFKVYLFNITNPDDVTYGARPILKEIGPYYYEQFRERVNIIDQPKDEALRAQLKTTFYFNKEKSGNHDENDVVTILNVALLGTALKVRRTMPVVLGMMDPVLKEIFPGSDSAFLKTTVGKFLFDGITVINCNGANKTSSAQLVCDQVAGQLPRTVRQDEAGIYKFSMFNYKNVTREWYTTKRGLTNSSDVGRTFEWRNRTTVSLWKNNYCDMINGTDSTVFPPFPSQGKIYIFAEDVCRSVYAVYERRMNVKGIPTLRYVGHKKIFASGKTELDNKCFCNSECLEDGVIDLTRCHDAPVIASFPHFYLASDTYKNYAVGLEAKKELHETFIDLEEKAGAPMRGSKKIQLNMFLTRFPQLDAYKNVSEGLFPIVWVDEGAVLEGKNLLLVQNTYKKLDTLNTIKWIIVGVGIAALVGAFFLYFSQCKDESKSHCCGKRHSNQITDVSPNISVSITTLDGLLRDSSTPVQSFQTIHENSYKQSQHFQLGSK